MEHQGFQESLVDCGECLDDLNLRMESYSSLVGGRSMLEQRLNKFDELIASSQDVEIKINFLQGDDVICFLVYADDVILGRGEKILPSTSLKGRNAVEREIERIEKCWKEFRSSSEINR